MKDRWPEVFADRTEGIPSPRSARLWAGIAAVSMALGRRCEIETGGTIAHTNLYVALCGEPGVGKTQALRAVRSYLHHIENSIYFLPSVTTREQLFVEMRKAHEQTGDAFAVGLVPEMHVFLRRDDGPLAAVLSDFYDCAEHFRYATRTQGEVTLERTGLALLCCVPMAWVRDVLTAQMLEQGLPSRFIWVHLQQAPEVPVFGGKVRREIDEELVRWLESVAQLRGTFEITEGAKTRLAELERAGLWTRSPALVLRHWWPRRKLHFAKLSAVAAASRCSLKIEAEDIDKAREWIEEADRSALAVFGRADVLPDGRWVEEVMRFIEVEYEVRAMPVTINRIAHAFGPRVGDMEKLNRIIDVLLRAQLIRSVEAAGGAIAFLPLRREEGEVRGRDRDPFGVAAQ